MQHKASSWVLALGACFCPLGLQAEASSLRVVVLASETLDGAERASSSLSASAAQVLTSRGVSVVDAPTALATQRHALSDQIAAGSVPAQLSALNADAVLALSLACDRSSGGVLGTKILAYGCVFESRLVRLGSGEVLASERADFTGHGLNAQGAVQTVVRKPVAESLGASVDRWLARERDPKAAWELQLVVTRVSSHENARSLVPRLRGLPGLDEAELVLFDRSVAKYALRGRGHGTRAELGAIVDADPDLALTLTFAAPGVLHAQYDDAEARGRQVLLMAVAPHALLALLGRALGAVPLSLPYLQMAHSAPLVTEPPQEQRVLERLRREANKRSVPLLLNTRLDSRQQRFRCGLDLHAARSGKVLLSASAEHEDAAAAIDQALRAFDGRFRGALAQGRFRTALGLSGSVEEQEPGLIVTGFHVQASSPEPKGRLSLENRGAVVAQSPHIAFVAADRTLLERTLPDMAASSSQIVELPVATVRAAMIRSPELEAVVSYRQGEHYGRTRAFAPLAAVEDEPVVDGAVPIAYRRAVERALAHHREGAFDRAWTAFQEAHALHPNARTLRGLGFVAFDLGRYADSLALLQEALESQVRPLPPQLRVEVAQVIVRLERMRKVASQPNPTQ
jgi:tetratricopeptide (TPR) repeat protein